MSGLASFRTRVHYHDDDVGLFEGDLGLTINFGGNEVLVVRKNSAGIDNAELASLPFAERRKGGRG